MKTLISIALISVLAVGFLLAVSPNKADAWFRGPRVSVSVVVPPFGLAIGAPTPYYYPGPVYVAPPYPVYEPVYYGPYYGPHFFRHRHLAHRGWRGQWHERAHMRWDGRY